MVKLWCILLFLLLSFKGIGQKGGTGHFATDPSILDLSEIPSLKSWDNRLVRFKELPNQMQRQHFEKLGWHFWAYQGNNTYLVSLPNEAQIQGHPNVISVDPISSKRSPELQKGRFPDWCFVDSTTVKLQALWAHPDGWKNVQASLIAEGFQPYKALPKSRSFVVEVSIAAIREFMALPYVIYAAPFGRPALPENNVSRPFHRSNMLNTNYAAGRHYDGSGVGIMLQDDGLIGQHIDFEGRISAQYLNFDNGNHGDRIAGILLGAGNLNPAGAGAAPGAQLYVYDANNYLGFDSLSLAGHYNLHGIRIVNTSYADGCNTGYNLLAATQDQLAIDNLGLLSVFSAGNLGFTDCGYGAGSGWGNITGGHKSGKNVLAIGSVNEQNILAANSSRGPATDGRVKPDLVARGRNVFSTNANNGYNSAHGTSFAAPGVAGVLAQLTQTYREIYGVTDVPGGLLKAVALNAADDIYQAGPDFYTGWGRINANRAIKILEDGNISTNTVDQGGTQTLNLSVPAGVRQLKAMLYWTDPAALPSATKALVNDLDLTLTDPTTTIHLPLILNHVASSGQLGDTAIPGVDTLNNVEQVTITNPPAGMYSINISGSEVPFGPQEFFVVYQWEFSKPEITHPTGGEAFLPGEIIDIFWESPDVSGTFDLEYQSTTSGPWTNIVSGLAGDARTYEWTLPTTVSGEYRLRILRGGTIDTSTHFFSIIGVPQNLNVDWVCPDSMGLSWNAITGASAYQVNVLGTMYMDSIGTSVTNQIVIPNLHPLNEHWFSVQALGPQNAVGRRSIALKKMPGIVNCVLPTDVANAELISPGSGALPDCFADDLNVKVRLQNTGTQPISFFDIFYSLDGQPDVSASFVDTLLPGEDTIFPFPSTLPLDTGVHSISIWTALMGDENPYNDTLKLNFYIYEGQTVLPSFVEDLEGLDTCSTEPNCEATSCVLNNGWHNERNGFGDQIDWRTQSGPTPSTATGPTTDHNPGTATGKYLYLESTNCNNKTGHLLSPCLDLNGTVDPKFRFYYHMLGSNIGRMHIDVYSKKTGRWTEDATSPILSQQGSNWFLREFSLNGFQDDLIMIRFRAVTQNGNAGDIALDNFGLADKPIANFSYTDIPSNDSLLILFSDLSSGGTSIVFSLGDGTTISNSDTLYNYQNPGIYNVTQIVSNFCGSDTLAQTVGVFPTGIYDFDQAAEIKIFPNPGNGLFTLSGIHLPNGKYNLRMVNSTGQLVFQEKLEVQNQKVQFDIDGQGWATGIYNLLLSTEGFQWQFKVGKR